MSPAPPQAAPAPAPATGDSRPERPLGALVKHSAIYSAAPILRQLIGIGMTRLYTDWLGNSGYGVKENVDLWLIGLQQVLGYNVLASMVRFYFDQKDERDRDGVVSSCTLLVTFGALVLCGLGLLFVPQLTPLMLGRGGEVTEGELGRICTLLLLLVPFQLASTSGFYYLMSTKRSGLFTLVQTAKLLFEVALNFYWIGVRGFGVRGFLLSMLIGEVVTALWLCGWILWRLGPRLDWRLLRPVLLYSAPLVPVGLLQLLLHNLDRRLVLEYGSQALAGTYGLGYRIAYLVTNMVLGPFIQTWQPWIFAVSDPEERARLVARVGTYSVLAIAVASLGVILFGRQAAQILANPSFWDAYQVIPFVATGYVFWALYHVSQTPLFIEKRTGRLLFVNTLAVGLNVGLNLWWIPRLGIVGAAMATLATFVALAMLGVWAGKRTGTIGFELDRLGRIFCALLTGAVLGLAIDVAEDLDRIPYLAALAGKLGLFGLLVLLLWTRVLRADERAHLRAWVGARLARR